MKKIIACIIVLALLLSCFCSTIYATEDNIEQKYITVDARGTFYTQTVYESSNGTIFVPITMLSQFGGMSCSEGSSQYTFYYKSETSRGTPLVGARRIFIDKSGKTGKVVCYTSQSNYTTIENITFSKSHIENNKLYLPLEEFLPLFNAKVEITNDGILHIAKNPVSVYSAILGKNLDLFVFDSDAYLLNDLTTATGLIVDTVLGRFDRLDFINNTGAIKDYSNLFKKLLTDNGTYLSAFDRKKTPVDQAMELLDSAAGDLDDAISGTKDMLKLAKYMSTSPLHKTYQEFSDSVKQFNDKADVVEAAIKVMEYANAYYNQVDDHRNMLMAVYKSGSSPAAVAATEVYSTYSDNFAMQITGAATSALRNYISKEVSGIVTKGLGLEPYKVAVSAVKLAIPGAVKEFSKAAEIYFVDKVVEDARKTTEQQLNNLKFDRSSLENLRLSMMMTLVASKYGYETQGTHKSTVTAINSLLEQLYLAADSVACMAKGYYATKKSELSQSLKYIASTESTQTPTDSPDQNPTDSPAVLIPSEGLEFTLNDSGDAYIVSGLGSCTDIDIVIPATYNGLPVAGIMSWAFAFSSVEHVTIPNSVTDIGDKAFRDCYNLKNITIPSFVTYIGDEAFFGSGLTEVTFAGSEAFMYGGASSAFGMCQALHSITYGGTVDQWGQVSRYDNTSWNNGITKVICIDGVITLGSVASEGLEFTLADSGDAYYVSGLGSCVDRSIYIPSTYKGKPVIGIGDGAFEACDEITDVTIPDSVTDIGFYAFLGCDSLTSVTLPNSASIGGQCFSGCINLTDIVLPSGTTTIGVETFVHCENLTSITIPSSVTSIQAFALSYCSRLIDIIFKGTVAQWNAITKDTQWGWHELVPATEVICSDGKVSLN